jgi:hypothetical protein
MHDDGLPPHSNVNRIVVMPVRQSLAEFHTDQEKSETQSRPDGLTINR